VSLPRRAEHTCFTGDRYTDEEHAADEALDA
jgi:hypothetical protein